MARTTIIYPYGDRATAPGLYLLVFSSNRDPVEGSRILSARFTDPVETLLANAPWDDEPVTAGDRLAIDRASVELSGTWGIRPAPR